jgi:hypothetical protein
MEPLDTLAKWLILAGVIIIITGLILLLMAKIPGKLGRLPGDFYYERNNFRLYFPIATSIILSLALTVVLNLILFFLKRK